MPRTAAFFFCLACLRCKANANTVSSKQSKRRRGTTEFNLDDGSMPSEEGTNKLGRRTPGADTAGFTQRSTFRRDAAAPQPAQARSPAANAKKSRLHDDD